MSIKYKEIKEFNQDEISKLYFDAGWSSYTNDLSLLMEAYKCSLNVYGAYSEGELVGIVRVVGDGLTIIYIQDLIVLKSHQRQGIATELLNHVLQKYKQVRQMCLMSDNDSKLVKFYNANNFIEVNRLSAVSYMYHVIK